MEHLLTLVSRQWNLYKQKMIGFVSDVASVMRARRGVIELLRVEGQADKCLVSCTQT